MSPAPLIRGCAVLAFAMCAAPALSAPRPPGELDPAALQRLLDTAFDPRGPVLGTLGRVSRAELSPDGSRVVTHGAALNVPTLWDADTGQVIALLVNDPAPLRSRDFPSVILSVRFSNDGRLIARAWGRYPERPRGIDLWDGRTGLPVRAMEGDFPPAHTLGFGPDDTQLFSVHEDGIRIWDVATGHRLPGPAAMRWPVEAASIAPFGGSVWLGRSEDDAHGELRRTADGKRLAEGCAPKDAVFSTDGRLTFCRGRDPWIADTETGAVVARPHSTALHCAVPAPLYGLLVPATSRSGGAHVDTRWMPDRAPLCDHESLVDPRSGVVVRQLPANDISRGGRSGRMVGEEADRTLRVWTTRNHRPWHWAELPRQAPANAAIEQPLAMSPDGRAFALVLWVGTGERMLAVWQTDGRLIRAWPVPPGPRDAPVFSPSGDRLLLPDGSVFDLTAGDRIELPERVAVSSLQLTEQRRFAFLPDGVTVVGVSSTIIWWNARGGIERRLPLDALRRVSGLPLDTPLAARGRRAVVAGDGVWSVDLVTGQPLKKLVEPRAIPGRRPWSLVDVADLSPDGSRAIIRPRRRDRWQVVDTGDGRVLWDLPEIEHRSVDPSSGIRPGWPRFSPDGRAIFAVGRRAFVIDGHSGAILRTVPAPEGRAAMSPDGRWVAVGRDSGHVELWRSGTQAPASIPVFARAIVQLAFTEDGHHLLIAGAKLPALVSMPFPITRAALRAVACHNRPGWPTPGFDDCEAAP